MHHRLPPSSLGTSEQRASLPYVVLRVPLPSGNLLNRFAKEIDAIDNMIPDGLKMMLGYFFKLMEVCIIVLMATPFASRYHPSYGVSLWFHTGMPESAFMGLRKEG